MKKGIVFFLILLCPPALVHAETIDLNDGRVLEGKIIDRDSKCIKVDLAEGLGIMTYCSDEIKDIDGLPLVSQKVKASSFVRSQNVIILPSKRSYSPTISDQIHKILKHMGYPESTWPAIEKEMILLLNKINYPHLKMEALQARSNPIKLKAFVAKLGGVLEDDGYFDSQTPHHLVKLLTTSFANDDISQVIFSSPISFWQKVDSKKALVACTAISQLGSIILELLDIDVRVAFSPAHVFNCILLNDGKVFFVDFSNQLYEIVDVDQYYYNLASNTRMLKDQYQISPARIIEINAQTPSELQSDSLGEKLCDLYDYIYIRNDYATTPAILMNLANIYSGKGDYEQSIDYYNKAIAIDPDDAEGYRERGATYGNKGDLDHAISDLNKAIELFPDFADAFHERGSIYIATGQIDQAINDFNQAVIIDPNFAEAYHDRGLAYTNKGDIDQALSDYNKAIEIDPYFSEAYQSRAEAYLTKQEYDKSWSDIHTIEGFGDEANPGLIDKLKKSSDPKNYFFYFLLIGVPIMIFLISRFF